MRRPVVIHDPNSEQLTKFLKRDHQPKIAPGVPETPQRVRRSGARRAGQPMSEARGHRAKKALDKGPERRFVLESATFVDKCPSTEIPNRRGLISSVDPRQGVNFPALIPRG
jgi:hypothetical protein